MPLFESSNQGSRKVGLPVETTVELQHMVWKLLQHLKDTAFTVCSPLVW